MGEGFCPTVRAKGPGSGIPPAMTDLSFFPPVIPEPWVLMTFPTPEFRDGQLSMNLSAEEMAQSRTSGLDSFELNLVLEAFISFQL